MRFVVRLLFLASLAAVLLVPAATAADRMWVGFHDDPMLRWDETRTEAMDRARGNEAAILRTSSTGRRSLRSAPHRRRTRSTPRTSSVTSTSTSATRSCAGSRC